MKNGLIVIKNIEVIEENYLNIYIDLGCEVEIKRRHQGNLNNVK
jgi:hypothetical protein